MKTSLRIILTIADNLAAALVLFAGWKWMLAPAIAGSVAVSFIHFWAVASFAAILLRGLAITIGKNEARLNHLISLTQGKKPKRSTENIEGLSDPLVSPIVGIMVSIVALIEFWILTLLA